MVVPGNDVLYGDWSERRTCVVLGGRGFLGRSLVNRLLRLGEWIVRVADSQSLQLDPPSDSDSLLSSALSSGQASFCQVDVRDVSQICKAIKGAFVVFYMDPSDLDTNDFCNCYMIIVQGAKNVINACRECKVRRLVYNSSADVVFDGSQDIHNGDESLTCPWKFQDKMIDLKAQAEALIVFANNIDGLLTCALRPSNVFGPGDAQLVPLLVNFAKCGLAKFIIGSGENMSDFTFSENIAHETLDSRVVSVAGKVFFITNLEPMLFWEFVSLILEGLGFQRPFIKVPTRIFWYILLVVKWMKEKLHFKNRGDSTSAHYLVQLASRTRTFDCTAAKRHIGYSQVVSLEEGITSTVESFTHLAKDFERYSYYEGQSKAEKLLGGGKVSDILLWRDERKTFTCFLALALVFYWFFLCGRTFISSMASLLLWVAIVLCGYGIIPLEILDLIWRIRLPSVEISETVMRDSIRSIAYEWNRGARTIRSLAKGENWNTVFKVAGSLYAVKFLLSYSVTVLTGMILVFAFTAFFIYEQYEFEIDGLAKFLFNSIMESKALLARNLPASVASYLHNFATPHQPKTLTVPMVKTQKEM
ncbi:hypothetical protein SLA2020_091050 [Shorea laevis]